MRCVGCILAYYFMKTGLFITFEGGEGSGKTTVVNGLKERLLKDGYKVISTREPGGCSSAEEIRNLIMKYGNLSPMAEAALYAAARKQHCEEVILPALETNTIILCDRYIHSNMVYQGYVYAGEIGLSCIERLNKTLDIIWPDMTFFLDVKPEIGLKRIQKNGRDINRFDLKGIDFHNKVYQGFKKLEKSCGLINVDASKSSYEDIIDGVYSQIIKKIEGK